MPLSSNMSLSRVLYALSTLSVSLAADIAPRQTGSFYDSPCVSRAMDLAASAPTMPPALAEEITEYVVTAGGVDDENACAWTSGLSPSLSSEHAAWQSDIAQWADEHEDDIKSLSSVCEEESGEEDGEKTDITRMLPCGVNVVKGEGSTDGGNDDAGDSDGGNEDDDEDENDSGDGEDKGDDSGSGSGSSNDEGDDSGKDEGDDSSNDKGDDSGNDEGDDSGNDEGDDSGNDEGDEGGNGDGSDEKAEDENADEEGDDEGAASGFGSGIVLKASIAAFVGALGTVAML